MRRFTAVTLSILLLLAACQETAPPPTIVPSPPPQILRLGLAASAAPLAHLVEESYLATTDQAILQFVTGNTESLWQEMENGRLDAIFVHHIPPGKENWFNPVALDGLTILVHPDNPLDDLSLAEVQALFNGRLQNWQVIGGADQPVTILSRETGSGALALLNRLVMAEQRLNINATVAPSAEGMLRAVADNSQAVGFSMMGQAAADSVKSLSIDGIAPEPDATAGQNYPLTVPLYFVHNNLTEPEGELRLFLAWLQSEAGQEAIGERYGRVR